MCPRAEVLVCRLVHLVSAHCHCDSVLPADYCEVNLCHNGGTCVTGVGDDPFICICADGFAGDTCNLTETGRRSPRLIVLHSGCPLTPSFHLPSQGPAAPTPAGTKECVRWWRRPDEGMFSTSTCASAGQASRGSTARPVSSSLVHVKCSTQL